MSLDGFPDSDDIYWFLVELFMPLELPVECAIAVLVYPTIGVRGDRSAADTLEVDRHRSGASCEQSMGRQANV